MISRLITNYPYFSPAFRKQTCKCRKCGQKYILKEYEKHTGPRSFQRYFEIEENGKVTKYGIAVNHC